MKKQLIAILALMPALVMAQTGKFTLTGKIGKLNAPAKAYFAYDSSGVSKFDSCTLVNGVFKFSGGMTAYSSVALGLDHVGHGVGYTFHGGDVIYFYMSGENVKIVSKDSIQTGKITGSKTNQEFEAFNKVIGGSIISLTKTVHAEYKQATPEQSQDTAFMNAISTRHRQRLNDWSAKQFEFAEAHPDSYFSLVGLSAGAGLGKTVLEMEPIYNKLNQKLKLTDVGIELGQRINAAHSIAVGLTAPSFTQNNLEGKPVSLTDKRGKYLLVEFWASWCGPCRAENPNLLQQYNRYKGKGFDILGISLDSEKNFWHAAVEKDGMPWTQLSDLKGWNNEVARLYGVRAVPASYLIDPQGKVVAINLRGEALNKKLEELMPD